MCGGRQEARTDGRDEIHGYGLEWLIACRHSNDNLEPLDGCVSDSEGLGSTLKFNSLGLLSFSTE